MVGRNDPCPCGSGKKYKKCCSGKSEASMEKVIEDELSRILFGIYEQPLTTADLEEFNQYKRQWERKLGKYWGEDSIHEALTDYFLFVARRDLWIRYLLRTLTTTMRSAVRSVIETWQTPIVLFGKVKRIQDKFIEVEEVLGSKTYYLEKEDRMPLEKNSIVFGVALPDHRNHPNGIYLMTSLMFVYDGTGTFEREVTALAKSSGYEKSIDFYKEYMVDIYEMIVTIDERSVDHVLTEKQQEVVRILEDRLNQFGVEAKERELLQNISVTYLLKEQPNFRKPSVISAAVFLTALDFGLISLTMTNSEIAKLFNVSTSSMTKHSDSLSEFVVDQIIAMDEEGMESPHRMLSVGADPLITERVNWEMYVNLSRKDFDTFEEMQAYADSMVNEPFQPEGNREQAQSYAYAAYDSEGDRDRYRFAEKVLRLDAQNVDGLLLKAELVEAREDIERLYQKAIQLGKMQFEEVEDNPWGLVTNRPYMRAIFKYGVWLFEEGRFEQAGSIFNDLLALNPEDNQGARYLAISAFIQIEEYGIVASILDDYSEGSEWDATFLYLDWFLEACMSEGESEGLTWMFEKATKANPFVAEMIESNIPKLDYPRRLNFSAGSIEEAKYIWGLLD